MDRPTSLCAAAASCALVIGGVLVICHGAVADGARQRDAVPANANSSRAPVPAAEAASRDSSDDDHQGASTGHRDRIITDALRYARTHAHDPDRLVCLSDKDSVVHELVFDAPPGTPGLSEPHKSETCPRDFPGSRYVEVDR